MPSIDRRAWSHLLSVALPFWRSDARWRAFGTLGLILFFLLALNGLNVVNSYVGREFMSAVAERKSERYYTYALLYVAVFAGSTLAAVLYQFTQDRLALAWRVWLSRRFIERYLDRQAYFRIQTGSAIDNPDQRISEDIKTFTTTLLSFLLMILNAAMTAIAFAGVLWLITPWLLVTAVLYSILGSLLTMLIGRRLPGLDNLQLQKEADLRYALVRVREYSESIALLQGEQNERARLGDRLRWAADNFLNIIRVHRNVGFFTSGYNYLVQIIPVLIVAPRYVRGEVEFGVVTQSAMAFSQILGALSLIVAQFQPISAFTAVIRRLGAMRQAIEEAAAARRRIDIAEDDSRVAFERLTLRTPTEGELLVEELSLEIRRGRRLLIVGTNGAGKSALFRATAGLWDEGDGSIVRPHDSHVMFLPQRPYMASGPFRGQLLYGLPHDRPHDPTDTAILETLHAVGLGPLLHRLGGLEVERDWTNTLSQGEQQLVAIARLLLAKPPFAFLDHATSALEPGRRQKLYESIWRTGITYLSIGDRLPLERFHDELLELGEGGHWHLSEANGARGALSATAAHA